MAYADRQDASIPAVFLLSAALQKRDPKWSQDRIIAEARDLYDKSYRDRAKAALAYNLLSEGQQLLPGSPALATTAMRAAVWAGGLSFTEAGVFQAPLRTLLQEMVSDPRFWDYVAAGAENDIRARELFEKVSTLTLSITPLMSNKELRDALPIFANPTVWSLLSAADRNELTAEQVRSQVQGQLDQLGGALAGLGPGIASRVSTIVESRAAPKSAEPARIAEIRREYATYRAYFAVSLTAMRLMGAGEDVTRVAAAGMATAEIGQAVALYSAGALTGVGTAAVVVKGVSTISGMLGGGPGGSGDGGLSVINSKLNAIISMLREGFAAVNERLEALLYQSSQIYQEVVALRIDVAQAREQLAVLQASLGPMEDRLVSQMRVILERETGRRRSYCLTFGTRFPTSKIDLSEFAECLNNFVYDAETVSREGARFFQGDFASRDGQRVLATYGSTQSLLYLARFANRQLGVTGLDEVNIGGLADLYAWAAASNGYLAVTDQWPDYARFAGGASDDIDTMARTGNLIRTVLDRMAGASSDARERQRILEALLGYYRESVRSFSNTIEQLEDAKALDQVHRIMETPARPEARASAVTSDLRFCDPFRVVGLDFDGHFRRLVPGFPVTEEPIYETRPASQWNTQIGRYASQLWYFAINEDTLPTWIANRGGSASDGDLGEYRMSISACENDLRFLDLEFFLKNPQANPMLPEQQRTHIFTLMGRKRTDRLNAISSVTSTFTSIKSKVIVRSTLPRQTFQQRFGTYLQQTADFETIRNRDVFISEQLRVGISGLLLQILRNEGPAIASTWTYVGEQLRTNLSATEAAQTLDSAAALLAAYIEVAMPSLYSDDATKRLLSGPLYMRLPNSAEVRSILDCLNEAGANRCRDVKGKMAEAAAGEGIATYLRREADERLTVLEERFHQSISTGEAHPLLDITLLRLDAARLSLRDLR